MYMPAPTHLAAITPKLLGHAGFWKNLSGGKGFPPRAPQPAGRTVAAAITPGMAAGAIPEIAAVRFLPHQLYKSVAAKPAGERPRRSLVAPHQRRVDHKPVV